MGEQDVREPHLVQVEDKRLSTGQQVGESVWAGDVCIPVDLDGDGDLDFVTGWEGQGNGTIEFWEYKDDGTGAEWIRHILQDDVFGCRYLAVADMDNDSDLDIVGVANGDGLVAWWENDGDYGSTWTMHLIAGGLDSPGNLYVADFDLDGDMDVAGPSAKKSPEPWHGGRTWTAREIRGFSTPS